MAARPGGHREVEELRGEDERRGYSEDRDLLLVESVADFVEGVCDCARGHAVGSPPGLEVEQPVRDMHSSTSSSEWWRQKSHLQPASNRNAGLRGLQSTEQHISAEPT